MNQKGYRYSALAALAAAGLTAAAGSAHAGYIIDVASQARPFDASKQDGPVSGEFTGAAFDAEMKFLSRLDNYTMETFETGFAHNNPATATKVGAFKRDSGTLNGTGNDCEGKCLTPMVFNQSDGTSNTGRYDITGPDGKYYLDSNDVPEMVWDVGDSSTDSSTESQFSIPESSNALGFYLMDPADNGASFQISTYNPDTASGNTSTFDIGKPEELKIDPDQPDGQLFYVSVISTTDPITNAALLFENTDEETNDGFGIDNATVGVPAPGMLAMLGGGLMAIGLVGRGRKNQRSV